MEVGALVPDDQSVAAKVDRGTWPRRIIIIKAVPHTLLNIRDVLVLGPKSDPESFKGITTAKNITDSKSSRSFITVATSHLRNILRNITT
jgi:hypothetical protein